LLQQGRRARAIDLKQALTATATPLAGISVLDQGAGVPNLSEAFHWMTAGHQAGVYRVRALPDGGNSSLGTAAYRRAGLLGPADTVQRFLIGTAGGQPAARLLLSADVPWLRVPPAVEFRGEPAVVSLTYERARLRAPGIYTGSVWARTATDTLAGWVLRLTNTIVVPYRLERPLSETRSLAPGSTDRFFLAVPEDAGGLHVTLELLSGRSAMLHLFEPSGQPSRAGSSLELAGADNTGGLDVPADDLTPGVYEAAVSAPPSSAITYRITAATPPVAVRSIGTGPSTVLAATGADSVRVRVRAAAAGVAQVYEVRGQDSPGEIQVPVPDWADYTALDIAVSNELWHQVTDIGVRVRDGSGRELSERPMDYAFDRRRIELDSLSRGRNLTVALRPAFARSGESARWQAEVRVSFLRREPLPLSILEMGERAEVTLIPGQDMGLQLAPIPQDFRPPGGYAMIVEVVAEPRSGPAARRRALFRPAWLAP
jgi:hypothetical protein